jgi:hypothetical protein
MEVAMRVVRQVVLAVGLAVTVAGCSTTASLAKPGFYTEARDGRLWVFREGSKDLENFNRAGT